MEKQPDYRITKGTQRIVSELIKQHGNENKEKR